MNIQHPDITAAERNGYPFPRNQTVTVTEELAKQFCYSSWDVLWDHLMVCFSDAIPDFLDNYAQEFNDYLTDV
jgi:hypothetical protein